MSTLEIELKISPSLQLTWAIANGEANISGDTEINPIHFLLAALKVIDKSFMNDEICRLNIPEEMAVMIRNDLDETRRLLNFSPEDARVQRRALRRKIRNYQESKSPSKIITLHRSADCKNLFIKATAIAAESNSDSVYLAHFVHEMFSKYPELLNELRSLKLSSSAESMLADNHKARPTMKETLIDILGKNLTELAGNGKLRSVVGRDEEMLQLLRYLRRTSKKNVIIIGEAGVGKTAVVEGLSIKLCGNNVPDELKRLKIFQINIPDLIAGASYRGDLEKRLKDLIKAAEDDKDIVIFFDEIHQLMNSSGSSSPIDIANILKPALARDSFHCIGATTTDEYDKYIKNDPAFSRRFQIMRVEEPSDEDALIIVKDRASNISRLQNVEFTEEALKAAIKLSKIYISDRRLPDKAIDLLENAAVYMQISSLAFEKGKLSNSKVTISSNEIISVLEQEYGIKVSNRSLLNSEDIEQRLRDNIIGQDDTIKQICKSFKLLAGKNVEQCGPSGVLLFTGPSGVGKSCAAEIITEAVFGDKGKYMFSINLNEYKEKHEVSRLIGAPPGFIGHDNPGSLFRYASNHTSGVIVLEEVDKAHPDVMDVFMQIFDKGETFDSKGRKISFKNYIFILTGNYQNPQKKKAHLGFDIISAKSQDDDSDLKISFVNLRKEFIARIDNIIKFNSIEKSDYSILVDKLLPEIILSVHNIKPETITIDDETRAWIVEKIYDEADGVRGARRRLANIIHEIDMSEVNDINLNIELKENRLSIS